ncbi:Isoprenylcysteine alpha-carbonyl methylesterase ICME [Linum perenne]
MAATTTTSSPSPPVLYSSERHRASSPSSYSSPTAQLNRDESDAETLLSKDGNNVRVGGRKHHHHPRRRILPKQGPPLRQKSFTRDIGHAACETYLVTGLAIQLLRYLGVGYRWITRLAALGLYAMLLMPGFLQVAYYYYFSSNVRRSITYGDQPRNRLDLHLPTYTDDPKPVVIFVTGGAWIIGYKAWGALLGKQLAERGIIVACVDYRNFPQGTISDMVTDASQAISFICSNISEYGGDPNRIYLMGQSAGAHISSCALLDQAFKEAWGEQGIYWSVSQIKGYYGLSGAYVNLPPY